MMAPVFATFALAVSLMVLVQHFIIDRGHHAEVSVWCSTSGSHMKWKTSDDNLYITFWCVKDGRAVP